MLFSTIISTIDSLKSLCGSNDDFTIAKLSDRLLLDENDNDDDDDVLFLPCPDNDDTLLPEEILGEFIRSLIPGEFEENSSFRPGLVFSLFFDGFVMIGGSSTTEKESNSSRESEFLEREALSTSITMSFSPQFSRQPHACVARILSQRNSGSSSRVTGSSLSGEEEGVAGENSGEDSGGLVVVQTESRVVPQLFRRRSLLGEGLARRRFLAVGLCLGDFLGCSGK